MKTIIRKRTNANGASLWSDDRTRVTGLAGGSRAGGSCSESRMGVGAFAFWATETFLLICRIKNNVLVGRIVPSIHSRHGRLVEFGQIVDRRTAPVRRRHRGCVFRLGGYLWASGRGLRRIGGLPRRCRRVHYGHV